MGAINGILMGVYAEVLVGIVSKYRFSQDKTRLYYPYQL